VSTSERFLPLSDLLRPPAPVPPPIPVPHEEIAPAETRDVPDRDSGISDALWRDVRLFRARLADALDAMRERLLVALACDVLARELRLAPADIAALAQRLIDERTREVPIRLHVAPSDLERVRGVGCAVVVDPALLAGDAVLECESGDVDARLGVRLADALRGLR
jgi:hypothetical protein